MPLEFAPTGAVRTAGSVLVALFALAVALYPPRSRTQLAFGTYGVAFGVGSGMTGLHVPGDPAASTRWFIAASVFLLIAAVALVVLLRDELRDRTARRVAAAVGLAVGTVAFALLTFGLRDAPAFHTLIGIPLLPAGNAVWFVGAIMSAVSWGGAAGLGVVARRGSPERVRQAALLATGLVIYPSAYTAALSLVPNGMALGFGAAPFVGAPCMAATWLLAARDGQAPRIARNTAWVGPGAAVAGMVALSVFSFGVAGVSRAASVALLGYAVLRHNVLGLDVKVRWTVSKSTLAAVFIAVFFVVSEAAQEFFGDTFDSRYLGILSAGLLVFAIAPLQRFADRVAAKTVPVRGVDDAAHRKNRDVYVRTLRLALADRVLSADEERTLAHLAQELGIGAGEAADLKAEVLAERAPVAPEPA